MGVLAVVGVPQFVAVSRFQGSMMTRCEDQADMQCGASMKVLEAVQRWSCMHRCNSSQVLLEAVCQPAARRPGIIVVAWLR